MNNGASLSTQIFVKKYLFLQMLYVCLKCLFFLAHPVHTCICLFKCLHICIVHVAMHICVIMSHLVTA